MVLTRRVDGFNDERSQYSRSELREMNGSLLRPGICAQGGTMTATLKIDSIPTLSDESSAGL